jgi:hypothetical protein
MIMRLTTLAIVATMATSAQAYSPMRATAIKFFAANNAVQIAIDKDVCSNDSLVDVWTAGRKLSDKDRKAYAGIRAKLDRAYAKSEGTDSALAQVTADFCQGVVSER